MNAKENPFKLSDVVEVYYNELVAYFTKKHGSSSLASEIVHETYLRVRRARIHFHIENPRAYLYRAATNLATDLFRKDQIRSNYVTSESPHEHIQDQAPSADTVVAAKERLALLRRIVDELPPRCREVFILRKFEELEYEDIARQMGISRNMVEKHLRKALQYCRIRLEQES